MSTLHPAPYIVFFAVFFGRLALWQLQNVLMGRGALLWPPADSVKRNQEQPQARGRFPSPSRPQENRGLLLEPPQPVRHSPMGGCPVVFRRPGCTGGWRMPWRQEAMKDAASCDKPRGGACRL